MSNLKEDEGVDFSHFADPKPEAISSVTENQIMETSALPSRSGLTGIFVKLTGGILKTDSQIKFAMLAITVILFVAGVLILFSNSRNTPTTVPLSPDIHPEITKTP